MVSSWQTHHARDGRRIPAEASVQIIDDDRHPAGMQAIVRDVAERGRTFEIFLPRAMRVQLGKQDAQSRG